MSAARRAALAALRAARTPARGVEAAQDARDDMACRVANAVVSGVFPDPIDVEAYRLLAGIARRAERHTLARIDARLAARRLHPVGGAR